MQDKHLASVKNKESLSQGINAEVDFCEALHKKSIEEVIELKIGRFFDQVAGFYPDNLHELFMKKMEKPLISQVLKRVGGKQVQAAEILGINRNTLRKKMKIYGL